MANISSSSKVAYIYDSATDTWYPTAGLASTSADYDWTGNHNFSSSVSFDSVLLAKAGVNNFQNPAARDLAIPAPVASGTVVFVRQNDLGDTINQIQYYSNNSWVDYNNVSIDEKTLSYTITSSDVNKMIRMNSSSNLELIIPANSVAAIPEGARIEVIRYGSGEVSIVAASGSGVTIRSKNNNAKISTQYSGAMLTKIGTNEWHLLGDLKA
jgi:hypothetical protein